MNAESKPVSKGPCPKCRASGGDRAGDNLVTYDDGHSYCFKCGFVDGKNSAAKMSRVIQPQTKGIEMTGTNGPIKDRNISQRITEKFGVTFEQDKHHYPYVDLTTGAVVGTKVRTVSNKQFHTTGTFENTGLFGQQVWREGGKYVTVTEGEIDAMAVAEMFDGRWPVVSLKRGAGSAVKDIKESLEWLETFENVVLCFDQDEAGAKAVEQVLPLFSHNKAKVVTLPMKDAGDMLQNAKVKEFTSCWWDAKTYRPVDVVSLSDESCWDAFVTRGTEEVIPFPKAFGTLNTMMNGGVAPGEVTVIGALTSVGKSTVVYNLLHGLITETAKKIGFVFLEASQGEEVEKLVSIHRGQNISLIAHRDRDYAAYRADYESLISADRVHMVQHHGSSDVDELFSKMRFMVKGMDCDILILDPLQAAVMSNENGTIDAFMDRCLKLAKETNTSIIIVSHMRKPQTKDAHDVNEYDMKGSGSINQIAFNTILLSRDKMSDDEYTSNSTKVQLVKCRRTGRTGLAGWLYYEQMTSRLVAGAAPEVQCVADEEF